VLLTEHLSSPPYPFRRLCEQDIRGLIRAKAGVTDLPKPKAGTRSLLRRLKPAEVDAMVKAYEAGGTLTELGTLFKVDRTTAMRALKRRGVTIRELVPRLSPEDVVEAAALYRDGSSLSQLGEKFGVSPPTMSRALRKSGVAIRPPSGR
jgi:DNA-binding MarR family transcriptional regulator